MVVINVATNLIFLGIIFTECKTMINRDKWYNLTDMKRNYKPGMFLLKTVGFLIVQLQLRYVDVNVVFFF